MLCRCAWRLTFSRQRIFDNLRCLYSSGNAGASPVLDFTEEEIMLQNTARRFAIDIIKPKVREMDEKETMDLDIVRSMFENGFMGIEIPVDYHGAGMSFTSCLLAIEEISKIDPSIAVGMDIHNTLNNALLLKYGTDFLKQKYLPLMATKCLSSFCLSEPESGSDAFALKTTAIKSQDRYILNGSKMWISNAQYADIFILFANSNPSKGYKGISCFVIDKHTPGFTVGPPISKLGIRASSTCPIFLDNCSIPDTHLVGTEGHGYKYAIELLNQGRVGIAAQQIGICQGAVDLTLPYIKERKQFGKRILDFQSVQHDVADMLTRIECARLLTYNAARLQSVGQPFIREAAMSKYYSSELSQHVTSKCIDLLGGVGFTREFGVEKLYRDSKIGTIYEGSSKMQLTTIAKYTMME